MKFQKRGFHYAKVRKAVIPAVGLGIRYDMGNKLGILQANCEVVLQHPRLSEGFAAYLIELVKTL